MRGRFLLLFALCLASALGQVASTETEGKGGVDIFVSESYYPAADVDVRAHDALVIVGVAKQWDVMIGGGINIGVGDFTKQKQGILEAGVQGELAKFKGFKLMTLDVVTLPFTNRQSGTCSIFTSVTLNREVKLGKVRLTPLTGWAPTWPCPGAAAKDKTFSLKDKVTNFPFGVMMPLID